MTVNGINATTILNGFDPVAAQLMAADDALAKQGAKVAKQPIKDTVKFSKKGKKVAKASVGKNAKAAASTADNPGVLTKIKETVTSGVDKLKKTKIGRRVNKGIKDFKKTEAGKKLTTGVGKFANAVKKHPIAAVAVTALAAIIGTKLLSGGSDKVE